MIVEISRSAARDLEDIADGIALDNPRRAITFVDELTSRCLSLAEHPRRFPELKSLSGRAVRKLVHGSYVVLFNGFFFLTA